MRKIRNHKQFVDSLRNYRLDRGLSQKELAEETGLNQQSVARIETGQVSPTLVTIFKIVAALELEITIDSRKK